MEIKLTIKSDEKQYFSQTIALPCIIGRGRQCGVAILHPVVSRQHCEILEERGQIILRDLGSLNGTMYRGVRITDDAPISYGSEFSIGRLFFRIDLPNEEPIDDYDESGLFANASSAEDKLQNDLDERVQQAVESNEAFLPEGTSNEDRLESVPLDDDPFAPLESRNLGSNEDESEIVNLVDLSPDDDELV